MIAVVALSLLPSTSPLLVEDKPSVLDKLKFYATGRVRGESTFDQPTAKMEDRHRGRLRFRVGGSYEILDNLKAEARLSTSSDGRDANNPHWDFGDGSDGFSGADVVLDRFYIDWKTCCEGINVQVGKFGHVFQKPPVFGEYVWDDDVQPAGFAALWNPKTEGKLGGSARLAEYVAVENGDDQDPSVFGAQGNLVFKASDMTELTLSSSLYDWGNLDTSPAGFVNSNQGNTSITQGEFTIWDSFVAATYKGGPLGRTTGFAQLIKNVEDDAGEDNGYALGAQIGKTGAKRDLSFFASYYDFDANAFFSPVAQDDTPITGSGSNTQAEGMHGIIGGTQYFLADNCSLKLWVLTSDAEETENPYRLRLDLDFKIP